MIGGGLNQRDGSPDVRRERQVERRSRRVGDCVKGGERPPLDHEFEWRILMPRHIVGKLLDPGDENSDQA